MGLVNNLVTRFPNGLNTEAVGTIFNNLLTPNPLKYHSYLEDFDYYDAANWTVTETQAGATQALANGQGGRILLTNSAADDDVNQIQKVGQSFQLTAGKGFFLAAVFQVSEATQSDFAVGLQVTNTDGTDLTTVTDGVFFHKADGSTTMTVQLRKNATTGATSANVGTVVAATDMTVQAFYDGVDRLYYALNGTIIGYLDASSSFLPDTTLAPVLVIKNGDGNARSLNADYIFAAQER